MKAEPQKQHQWLQKLVGNWTMESECSRGPGQPAQKHTGTESVRSLGGLWVVCEGEGDMPGGGRAKMQMTLGFDPKKGRFVGTWIGSMMTFLWVYDGELDPSEKILTLAADGPDFAVEGKMARYRDIIEFVNDDYRMLRSNLLGPDGKWSEFMRAHYRRVK